MATCVFQRRLLCPPRVQFGPWACAACPSGGESARSGRGSTTSATTPRDARSSTAWASFGKWLSTVPPSSTSLYGVTPPSTEARPRRDSSCPATARTAQSGGPQTAEDSASAASRPRRDTRVAQRSGRLPSRSSSTLYAPTSASTATHACPRSSSCRARRRGRRTASTCLWACAWRRFGPRATTSATAICRPRRRSADGESFWTTSISNGAPGATRPSSSSTTTRPSPLTSAAARRPKAESPQWLDRYAQQRFCNVFFSL
mmetsp:Transcript_19079/g.65653  ORF Transcript_19079/g.65653 Transcript_19079/m.65653 type:complete len:260 (-) Transcript_19079:6-785(-)